MTGTENECSYARINLKRQDTLATSQSYWVKSKTILLYHKELNSFIPRLIFRIFIDYEWAFKTKMFQSRRIFVIKTTTTTTTYNWKTEKMMHLAGGFVREDGDKNANG